MFDNCPLSVSETHDFVEMTVLGEWIGWMGFNCYYRGYKIIYIDTIPRCEFSDNVHGNIT